MSAGQAQPARFDLVVIGSGPAGEKAAAMAAWFGKRVAVVERGALGGAAANSGTLSSKTLRETALAFSGHRQRGLHGVDLQLSREIGVRDLLHRERQVRAWEHARIAENLSAHGVTLVRGDARLLDAHTVEVTGEDGLTQLVAEFLLIATGSHPRRPATFPFELPHVYDSDEILDLEAIPGSLTVVGGGVIGSEYACIFAALGVPVTLIEARTPMLGFLDAEIRGALLERMQALGISFRAARVSGVEARDADVTLTLDDGGAPVTTDAVLVANGRTATTAGLGLEALGIVTGPRGHLTVDAHQRTSVPNIYAAGDVVGFPALASTSMEQGRIAVTHAFGVGGKTALAPVLPFAIYTIPEASMAGETEVALAEKGIPYVVGRCAFPRTARGRINGEEGRLKLLFHREDRRLLGVHALGEGAGDLVHQGLLVLLMGAGLDLFIEACFNYPTLSEAYKLAAYDALSQLPQGPTQAPSR